MSTSATAQQVSNILAAAGADPALDHWELAFVIDATNQTWDPLAIASFIKRRRDLAVLEKAIADLDDEDKAMARDLYTNRGMSIEAVLRFIRGCYERKKQAVNATTKNAAATPPKAQGS
jgi:hypothetical protein